MNSKFDTYRELRAMVQAQGYFEPTPARIIGECVLFVALTLLGVYLVTAYTAWWCRAAGIVLVSWSGLAMATNAHTASHNAVSKKRWVNVALTYFGYPFFLQVSVHFWHNKHISIHHRHPNIAGKDRDADLMPMFALREEQVRGARGLRAWWYSHQGLFFPVVLTLNSFGVVLRSWVFLIRKLIRPGERTLAVWADLFCLVLHNIVWIAIPLGYFAPSEVLEFNVARLIIISYGMFAIFAPAHYPAEAFLLTPGARGFDYVAQQAYTSLNFSTGPIGRLLCAGVNYQIEHHLFPTISHSHLPRLAPLVEQYCRQHGYPYRTIGWGEGVISSFQTLFRPKVAKTDLAEIAPMAIEGTSPCRASDSAGNRCWERPHVLDRTESSGGDYPVKTNPSHY